MTRLWQTLTNRKAVLAIPNHRNRSRKKCEEAGCKCEKSVDAMFRCGEGSQLPNLHLTTLQQERKG